MQSEPAVWELARPIPPTLNAAIGKGLCLATSEPNAETLLAALQTLGHPRVLVLGDLILDRYTWGNAERVSQEAPVILLRTDRREARPGGAANVAAMLRGLEARVSLAGAVGDDRDGRELIDQLNWQQIDTAGLLVDPARPTTVKERFIGRAANRHPHQILRVDHEVRDPLPVHLQDRLQHWLAREIPRHDVLLVSDYAKGVCTPEVLRGAIDSARRAGVPVIVDPIRGGDFARYRGATTMTPNRLEAEIATELTIDDTASALRAGRRLCELAELEQAIVTLDRDGMALVAPDGQGEVFPTRCRAVYDITGAGDIVLAMIGLAWAAGIAPAIACQLANVAAGLEVERMGVAVIARHEILDELQARRDAKSSKLVSLDQMAHVAQQLRQAGRRVVLTNGCFDLLHVGHVSYLEEAAALGDVLIVAVNSDDSVRRLKGPERPVIGERERASLLAALSAVSYVLVFSEDTPHELIRRIRPDVLVKGGTYRPDEVVGHELVAAYGGEVRVTGAVDGISTTRILASMGQRAQENQTRRGPSEELKLRRAG